MRKRMRACSSKTSYASASLRQHFFEKLQRPRIVRLPQPEHRLLPHRRITIRLRYFNQLRDALVSWQLTQRKDRLFLHFGVGIVVNRSCDGAHGFLSRFLRQPEERLPAHVRSEEHTSE